MQVPAHCGGSVSGYADTVKPPSGGGLQGGEGLADPAVLCFLEIAGQDSSLVLQLLHEGDTEGCEKRSSENVKSSF